MSASGRDQAVPRVDESTTARRFLWRSMIAHPRYMVPAVALSATHQVGEMLVPVVAGYAIDRGVATGDGGELLRWILVLTVTFALLSISYRYSSRLGWIAMNFVDHDLRMRVSDAVLHPRGLGGPRRLPGELMSISSTDTNAVARTKAVLIYPVGAVVGLVFAAVVLIGISWPLGVAALGGAVIVVALSDRIGAPLSTRVGRAQAEAAKAAGTAADLMGGVRVIHGLGAQAAAADRYRRRSAAALDATLRANSASATLTGTLTVFGGMFVVAIAVAAGLLAVAGDITVGQLITVIGLAQLITEPINFIGRVAGVMWASGKASAERVLGVLQAPHRHGGRRAVTDNSIVLIVDDDEIVVPPTGLTVVDLPARLSAALVAALSGADEEPGRVRVGDHDAAETDPALLRAEVLVAPHGADLFDGTVADNIAAGASAAGTGVTVDAAVLAAGLDEFVPDGLGKAVGESGTALSGGQRQRVALGRALHADAPILVLDDPTTAVDSVTEARIVERVDRLRGDRPTIVFTGSPAWRGAARAVLTADRLTDHGRTDAPQEING